MGSGPRTGLAEIRLPDLQPGSSIMPGKVNPVIPEVVTQVGAQVIGNDAAIAFAGSQGNFELNVFVPVIARNLLESIALLDERVHACSPTSASPASRPNVERLKAVRGVVAVDRHRAQPVPRLRGRGRDHQGSRPQPGKSIREIVQAAQADDRRRARPRARRRGDDPRRHHRIAFVRHVVPRTGSKRAIIAAFLANLGIALSKFVAFLRHRRGVDARRGDPLGRRHRQPGPAVARRHAVAASRPTTSTRSATAPRATSGRSSSRSCCSASAACSRSSKASRSCATRTSSRTSASRSACCSFAIVLEGRGRSAPRYVETNRGATPASESWWQFIRHTKSPELPVVLLEDTGALVGLGVRAGRRDRGATSPTNPAGTRPAASRSASCSS